MPRSLGHAAILKCSTVSLTILFSGPFEEVSNIDINVIAPALNKDLKNCSAWFHLGALKVDERQMTKHRIGHVDIQANGNAVLIKHGQKVKHVTKMHHGQILEC